MAYANQALLYDSLLHVTCLVAQQFSNRVLKASLAHLVSNKAADEKF